MAARRLILDSSAVSAIADRQERAAAWLVMAVKENCLIGIPAPVLGESMTGGAADANVYRLLRPHESCIATTAEIAITAAALRAKTRLVDKTVDALVVASAMEFPGSIILTGDSADIGRLVSETPGDRLCVRSI